MQIRNPGNSFPFLRSELIRGLERELILEIDHQAPNPFNISALDEENEFEPEENTDLSRWSTTFTWNLTFEPWNQRPYGEIDVQG